MAKKQVQVAGRTLVTTEDGSHSIFAPQFNEHYHSIHGAIQESDHIFIDNGLKEALKSKSNISIFEMGFGTGLNAFLTLIFALNHSIEIRYSAIEAFPVEGEMLKRLNYAEIMKANCPKDYFAQIHSVPWEKWNRIIDNFQIKRHYTSLLDYQPGENYDLVYFDAFAPDAQPELWTADVFKTIFDSMNSGGILVTYCCKGDVKRNLKSSGFTIEKLPGPPGKREILRARKV